MSAGLVAYAWSDDPTADIKEGMEAAAQATYLDDKDPYAHYAFAIASAYGRAPRQGVLAAEKAVTLNRSFALSHAYSTAVRSMPSLRLSTACR